MLTLSSQFCTKLISSFKDLRTIYLLEEFCPGGTVLVMLQRQQGPPTLKPTCAGNVLGCVILGLRCCHDHNILVRALAPENLFIDANGLIKLGVFEYSKRIMPGEFTMTVCGSQEFMPPEQMYGHGQTLASDFWSVGCLMYELLTGVTPFSDPLGSILNVHGNILQGINDRILSSISIDDNAGQLAKEVVEGLLQNNAEDRLGAKDFNDLQQHLWFGRVNVDMNELESGRFSSGEPDWKPKINSTNAGKLYYVDGKPLRLEDVVMNGGGNDKDTDAGRITLAEESADRNHNSNDWHWVF